MDNFKHQQQCIFCKIINQELPASVVYEDNDIIAFKDIKPKAETHVLVMPKRHIASLKDLSKEDFNLVADITNLLPKLAEQQGLINGFRTIINTGPSSGQEVEHLHYHLLGGAKLPGF